MKERHWLLYYLANISPLINPKLASGKLHIEHYMGKWPTVLCLLCLDWTLSTTDIPITQRR